jgi:hypothetical protein
MTLFWDLAKSCRAVNTCCGSAYFNCTISVMNFPEGGRLSGVLVEKVGAAEGASFWATTLKNLSPTFTTVIPFIPRIVSRASIASDWVRSL